MSEEDVKEIQELLDSIESIDHNSRIITGSVDKIRALFNASSEALNIIKAERDELLAAVNYYANEHLYFPRGIVLECQRRGIRLAPIYSDFGDRARAALSLIKKE